MAKTIDMAARIAVWKAKYGEVYAYTAKESDAVDAPELTCYLKRPERQVLSLASVKGQNDPLAFAEVIVSNCWLGGDECLRTDDKYFLGLSQHVSALVEVRTGELKKL